MKRFLRQFVICLTCFMKNHMNAIIKQNNKRLLPSCLRACPELTEGDPEFISGSVIDSGRGRRGGGRKVV
jgi:hypothetical protein